MPRSEFEKLIVQGYEKLPEWVREKVQNVALLVEDEPSEEDRKREGLGENETLLGLYKGIPLSARGEIYGVGMTLPDTITIYQKPIEDAAREQKKQVSVIVYETIWHEFAHHFGMDEHEVRMCEESGANKKGWYS